MANVTFRFGKNSLQAIAHHGYGVQRSRTRSSVVHGNVTACETRHEPVVTSYPPRRNLVALVQTRQLELTIERDDWRDVALCRDTDPDLFFPVGTTGPAIEQIESAKAVCNQCEAQAPCLEYAIATNQDSGVWGGTSEEERRQLRKRYATRQRRTA
jgi:WhiB family redox-sensing transcriptional regulator